jgi:solute carrier family 25 S-adenosylmethionine transporter 26
MFKVKNLMGGISSIVKAEGIKGLFSGYFSTLVRDVPYTMLELGLYENIKMMMRKFQQKDELNPRDELFAAAVTGAVTGFITTPLDVVKTKLMLEVCQLCRT